MSTKTTLAVAGVMMAAALITPTAPAQALPPNCVTQPWLYGGLFGRWTTRTICDGPIQPDGSWLRRRNFYANSTYVPVMCSWGTWGGSCYGGYWLPVFDTGIDEYPVRPETVLPDEPPHLDDGGALA